MPWVRLAAKRNKFGTFMLHDLKLSGQDLVTSSLLQLKVYQILLRRGTCCFKGVTLGQNLLNVRGRQDIKSFCNNKSWKLVEICGPIIKKAAETLSHQVSLNF